MELSNPAPGVQVLLIAIVFMAAAYDMHSRKIPNWVSVAGFVLGLALNTFLYGAAGLKDSLLSFAVGFGVYFALYALRAMGAGDVKLMGAVGAIVGRWENWLGIFLVTAVIGGAAALGLSIARGRLRRTIWNVRFILGEMFHGRAAYVKNEELDVRSDKALRLPHGAIIFAGTILFLAMAHTYAR
jgi:prepilin peptidase CpaA